MKESALVKIKHNKEFLESMEVPFKELRDFSALLKDHEMGDAVEKILEALPAVCAGLGRAYNILDKSGDDV